MKNSASIRRPNYAACRRRSTAEGLYSAVPNGAKTRYFLEKLLDSALAAATTFGIVVIFLFILTLT